MPGQGVDTRPRRGQDVTIRLKATLEDGSVVEEDPALTFTLGDCDVLQVRAGRKLAWFYRCLVFTLQSRISPRGCGEGLGSMMTLCAHQKRSLCPCLCSLPTMLFPAGSGLVRAAPRNGGDGFDCVRCKVLLRHSGEVSREGTRWSGMAPKRAVKAVTCAPGDSHSFRGRKTQLTCHMQRALPGGIDLHCTLSQGASGALILGPWC